MSGSMDERSWGCNNDVFNPTQPDFWAGLGNSFCNLGYVLAKKANLN